MSCTVAPGAALSLVVTAPEGIRTTQALALGRLGNLPLAPVTVTLVDVDHVAHTITGRQPLVAPASPGTWTLDVSVLGYHADQTIQLSVQ